MKNKKIAFIGVVVASFLFLLIFEQYKNSVQAPTKIDSNSVKVALVTDPLVGNNQFILQAYNEFLAVGSEYNFQTHHLEATNVYTWTEGTRKLCEMGYDLIIGLGWQSGSAFLNLAAEYPDIEFAVIDTKGNGENIRGVVYEVTDSCYALGVMLATAFPNEKTYGYIGNFRDANNFEYEYAYRQGILSVNPQANFFIEFASTYTDPYLVRVAAEKIIDSDVRVIMGSVTSSANEGIYSLALEKAKEGKFIYTTGLSVDQTNPTNPYIIGGLTKDTALPVRMLIESYLHGTYVNSDIVLGNAGEGFTVVHLNDKKANFRNKDIITDEVIKAGNDILKQLSSGTNLYTKENFN